MTEVILIWSKKLTGGVYESDNNEDFTLRNPHKGMRPVIGDKAVNQVHKHCCTSRRTENLLTCTATSHPHVRSASPASMTIIKII
ncbi:hypothetical protein AVEN_139203-1 [Araneus ventricosus]|uniref:Uncharacterized protein n=1 Tax=Araneus ventricosus TaxID=182803 RepID=A0A4Y2TJ92_ARAVE|nr:hypothetical protein AVEN_139203-1 [Araneus ventricosus]